MKKGLILILTLGVFSIINTEMGVVGILPLISENYGVTVATADCWSVCLHWWLRCPDRLCPFSFRE